MSRLGSRSMQIVGVAAALGLAVLIGSASAAAPTPSTVAAAPAPSTVVPAPAAVTTVSGRAVIAGTDTSAAGMTIKIGTAFTDGRVGNSEDADIQEVVIGVDGTYSFNLSYAANYWIHLEPSALWQSKDSPAAFDTTYAPGQSGFAAIPGAPTTCDITAVPTSTWTKRADDDPHPSHWTGDQSSVSCNDDWSRYTSVDRFWSPVFNNAHFFTRDGLEAYNIRWNDLNWEYEGVAFKTLQGVGDECTAGVPVYRFYSPVFQSHFYTSDATEEAHILANDRNWNYEGIAHYVVSRFVSQ